MYGDSRGVFRDNLFGLDIEGLTDFVWRCFAQSAFASDVGGDLDFWTVGEGVQTRIENAGRSSELDMKSAGQEECTESDGYGEPLSSVDEVKGGSDKRESSREPPGGGTREVCASDYPR